MFRKTTARHAEEIMRPHWPAPRSPIGRLCKQISCTQDKAAHSLNMPQKLGVLWAFRSCDASDIPEINYGSRRTAKAS